MAEENKNGLQLAPVVQVQSNRQIIVDRFKYCARQKFPQGVASAEQYRDVIQTWLMGWHQNLMHMNTVHGMRQPVNDEIYFFSLNFAECMAGTWTATVEFKWW